MAGLSSKTKTTKNDAYEAGFADGHLGGLKCAAADHQKIVALLLDAIKGLIDFIEIDHLPMNKDALQIARAAIAKAEGAESHG